MSVVDMGKIYDKQIFNYQQSYFYDGQVLTVLNVSRAVYDTLIA